MFFEEIMKYLMVILMFGIMGYTNTKDHMKEANNKKVDITTNENIKENDKWLSRSKALIKISLIGIPIDGVFIAMERHVNKEMREYENR